MLQITDQFLLVVIALLGLAGGVFSAFNKLGQRVAKIETHIFHISQALNVRPEHEEDE